MTEPEEDEKFRNERNTTVLTPDIQAKIVSQVEKGMHPGLAGQTAGVSPRTVRRWLRRGKNKGDAPYAAFYRAVRGAESEFEAVLVRAMTRGALKDGRVALDMAARRFPKRWGRNRLELTGKNGGPIGIRAGGTLKVTLDVPPELAESFKLAKGK